MKWVLLTEKRYAEPGLGKYVDWACGLAIIIILVAYVVVPGMGFFFNQTTGNALKNAPTYVTTLLSVAVGIGGSIAILVYLLSKLR